MPEGLLPPFVDPEGERADDGAVLAAYAAGARAPYSDRFHVEDAVLLVDRDVPAAIRIDDGAFLVRADLPDEAASAAPAVAGALERAGYGLADEETLLAVPVALQVVGLRISSWDLWGRDVDDAFAALRRAAAGTASPADLAAFQE